MRRRNSSKEGVSAEVIDLATLSPIDADTILASVAKTGRLVIVHEAARNVGVGAEIAAIVAEHGLYDLQAPIQRVTGFDTVMPLFRLSTITFRASSASSMPCSSRWPTRDRRT